MQWVCLIPRSPTPNPQPTPTTPVEDWLCSKPAKKQEKEDEQVREPVRVQLQNNLETESIPIEDLGDGVTTAQVVDALSTLNLLVPRRLQRNAAPAYRKAVKWTLERPPYGVSAVTKKSFYFDPYIDDWRFDIEVLDGHHLKR
jgi:hypothetical protein